MLKRIYLLVLGLFIIANLAVNAQQDFYSLKATTIDGKPFSFDQLKGKKVMIVNTASKCGFTKQYEVLEKVYQKYKSQNFVIIGFPSNDFLRQEPGTNEEIESFCKLNYGVSFMMMSKIEVKGKNIDPVYQWLTDEKLNGVMSSSINWNFQKYLIDENGKLCKKFAPSTAPDDVEIINWIEGISRQVNE